MPKKLFFSFFLALMLVSFVTTTGFCRMSKGETLYVPAYSSIYHGIKTRQLNLTSTLFVHNINKFSPITIEVVEYYNENGQLVSTLVETPTTLAPLATKKFIIPERDTSGGTGANFLVQWASKKDVNPPAVECLMVGSGGNLGVSFVIKGTPIDPEK
ncbi:MAG: DUF3124 domain-containing protein [Desulfovibrio sp.]